MTTTDLPPGNDSPPPADDVTVGGASDGEAGPDLSSTPPAGDPAPDSQDTNSEHVSAPETGTAPGVEESPGCEDDDPDALAGGPTDSEVDLTRLSDHGDDYGPAVTND